MAAVPGRTQHLGRLQETETEQITAETEETSESETEGESSPETESESESAPETAPEGGQEPEQPSETGSDSDQPSETENSPETVSERETEAKKGEVYGPYLATKKVGKNNPKAEEIKADNEIRMEWNRAVDRAIVSGVPEEEILELKKTEITDRVKESVEQNGKKPELFAQHFIIFSRVRLFLKQ